MINSNGVTHPLPMTHAQLREHAHWLAESQKVIEGNGQDVLLRRLAQNEAVLQHAFKIVEDTSRTKQRIVPAATWLLDNFYVLEEQIWIARRHLPKSYSIQLPRISEGDFASFPRVYAIVAEVIQHSDGLVDEETTKHFIDGYQEIRLLRIGELWAVPAMLRFALIQCARQTAARIATAAIDRRNANHWADRFSNVSHDDPEEMLQIMAGLTASQPRMSHAFIAELARRLQSIYPPPTLPLSWIHQSLAHEGKTLESIFLSESQQEAADQVSMSHAIGSLRNIESIDWQPFVEERSATNKILSRDPSSVFSKMDFATRDRYRHSVEMLARKHNMAEESIAQLAIQLCEQAKSTPEHDVKKTHVGYYLVDQGYSALQKHLAADDGLGNTVERLRRCANPYVYFGSIIIITVIASILFMYTNQSYIMRTDTYLILSTLTALVSSQGAITLVNWASTKLIKPSRIPRMDFTSGIPEEFRSMVVIPTMLSSPNAIERLMQSLEVNYLGNRQENLHFALLTDFLDSKIEHSPEDNSLLELAKAGIEDLNRRFSTAGTQPFYLFHRPRKWNPRERIWMGYERKRGKLMDLCKLMRGGPSESFSAIIGNIENIHNFKFLITLDTDTRLPHNTAVPLIAAMAHPLNTPRIDPKTKRVTEGYAILQPRVAIGFQSTNKTLFSKIFAGEPGIDPYTREISDVYQDLFGEGSFIGKGIFEIDAFLETLQDRFPENWILSHDLIESCIARSGLITDVMLHEEFPAHFQSDLSRRHRWIRGDWQISPWLLPLAPNAKGRLTIANLSGLARWKIFDNLRRSLIPPSILAMLVIGFLFTTSPISWVRFSALVIFMPTILTTISKLTSYPQGVDVKFYVGQSIRAIFTSAAQSVLAIIFLPYESWKNLDAIIRSAFRMIASKRRLLEWRSAHEVESATDGALTGYFKFFAPITMVSAVLFLILISKQNYNLLAISFLSIWTFAPTVAWWISKPLPQKDVTLSNQDVEFLRQTARDTWRYFEKYVNPSGHWLPPDNVQFNDEEKIAYRTSPTNIGLYLLSALAAYDFKFIDLDDLINRYLKTFKTMERLERYRGHFLNWYDTKTLQPLAPLYVSTVDSGNLTASLFTIANSLDQIVKEPKNIVHKQKIDLLKEIAQQARKLGTCDYNFLYNKSRRLLAIGFNVQEQRLDPSYYDLLASESRLASIFGIALGQLPIEHWYALGRLMNRLGPDRILLSWSGSMFEYLMPMLILPEYDGTILSETHKSAVRCQIEYGRLRGVPWGFLESGYFATDVQDNYQYRAFGVPGLGFKRGLGNDLVVAPYASMLALMIDPKAATANLRRLKEEGFTGDCGFYEAIDFTPGRIPPKKSHAVVRSFMAHHQGMGFLALAHVLLKQPIQRRFIQSPFFQSVAPLLEEAQPQAAPFPLYGTESPDDLVSSIKIEDSIRVLTNPSPAEPALQILSNGQYHVLIGAAGESLSSIGNIAINRYHQDPLNKTQGLFCYLRNMSTNELWTNTVQPSLTIPGSYEVIFTESKAEFKRRDGCIETHTEVTVSPEHNLEIRRIHLKNCGTTDVSIELTSFTEIALATLSEEGAHPAFSHLFLKTEILPSDKAILCLRRPRKESSHDPVVFHTMSIHAKQISEPSFETDRMSFLGRGGDRSAPEALTRSLNNKDGHVLDPIFSIRKIVQIKASETVVIDLIMGSAVDRAHALNLIASFRERNTADRIFDVAWAHSQVSLQQLNIDPSKAQLFNRLAGYLIYPQLGAKQITKPSLPSRLKNQSGLWGFGISGDLPIILLKVSFKSHIELTRELVIAHNYFRRKGMLTDLVIWNEDESSYRQQLQDEILSAIAHLAHGRQGSSQGGIFLIRPDQIPDDEKSLILTIAAVTINAQDGPSLADHLKRESLKLTRQQLLKSPRQASIRPKPNNTLKEQPMPHMSADGTEVIIPWSRQTQTPLPWVNVLANSNFGTIISERGASYTWFANAHMFRLTEWHNDPVTDPSGEAYYIYDNKTEEFWSPMPWPVEGDNEYIVRHGFGSSFFDHKTSGIHTETRVFIDQDEPVKYVLIRVRNESGSRRSLTVTGACEWVLGSSRKKTRPYVLTYADNGIIYARNPYLIDGGEYTAFFSCRDATSWTTDGREFLGDRGDWRSPEALKRKAFSGKSNSSLDSFAALRLSLELESNESREVVFMLGAAYDFEHATTLARIVTKMKPPAKVLRTVRMSWRNRLSKIEIKTPDADINLLANGWLLYQTISSRLFARSGFYQSGGAYGFRDQLQDVLAILHCEPDLAKAHILKCAEHQFLGGDVLHWWHPPSERGVRTMFSDDYLWLPFAVAHYVQKTGDSTLLDERRPFIEGRLLKEGEESYYDRPKVSEKSGTIYEHCLAAIQRGLNFGKHGLPLMGCGDWNDGMNEVGIHGRGESIWLGFFLYEVLRQFAQVAILKNDMPTEKLCNDHMRRLAENLDRHAWDGEWYMRAFFDDGQPLGSRINSECTIDSLPQSWSIISTAGDREKSIQAMNAVAKHLIKSRDGLIQLFTPPFDQTHLSPGYIKGYPPGVRENGGQYTHAAIWVILAFARLGDYKKAWELLEMINPLKKGLTADGMTTYKGEPYVVAADIYSAAPHTGRAGWTWYTGAAGWMYQLIVDELLGLKRLGDKLKLDPKIHPEWGSCSVRYHYKTTSYSIQIRRATEGLTGPLVVLDGQQLATNIVNLVDDHEEHAVTVMIP